MGLLEWFQNLSETMQNNISESVASMGAQAQARQQARQALIDQGQGLLSAQWNTRQLDPFGAVAEGFGGITSPVGKLPMDTASRMARAEAQGFKTDAYHGTHSELSGRGIDGMVLHDGTPNIEFYSTPDQNLANGYAGRIREGAYHPIDRSFGNVVPLKINTDNYHVVDAGGKEWTEINHKAIDAAKLENKSGVIVKNVIDPPMIRPDVYPEIDFNKPRDVFITLDPTTVRSRFAAFDPSKINSKDLLASFGGLLGLGAAADQANQNGLFGQ